MSGPIDLSPKRKPRVVFLSPLPPSEFGVPIYSARTVEALSRHASIDIIASKLPPIQTMRAVHKVIPDKEVRSLDEYDAKFFVYGNHVQHIVCARFASVTRQGVGIFHDAQQLDFAHALYRNDGALLDVAQKHLRRRPTFEELHTWFADRSLLPFPMLEPVSDFGHKCVVHSAEQARAFLAHYPHLEVEAAPVAIQHQPHSSGLTREAQLRAKIRCGTHEDQIHVGSFGFLGAEKLPSLYLFAVRHLHDWALPVHFWFVGSANEAQVSEVKSLASDLGLEDHVHFTGAISETAYMDYLRAMDVGVQLRRPYFGQLSGALLDCAAAGLPTVSTHALASAIGAPSYVQRIKNDFSSLEVAEGVASLIESGPHGDRGGLEWSDFCEVHSFDNYARRLLEVAFQ